MLPHNVMTLLAALLASQVAANALPVSGELELVERGDDYTASTSHNCGGKWGVVSNIDNVQKAYDTISNSGESCLAANSCTALSNPACTAGVRLGWCNTNKSKKCVTRSTLKSDIFETLYNCHTDKNKNYAGQSFYKPGYNVRVQHC